MQILNGIHLKISLKIVQFYEYSNPITQWNNFRMLLLNFRYLHSTIYHFYNQSIGIHYQEKQRVDLMVSLVSI